MSKKSAGFVRLLGGGPAGSVLGWAICALYAWLFHSFGPSSPATRVLAMTAYPNLFLVPLAMGAMAGWIWRPLGMKTGGYVLGAFLLTILCVGGSYFILHEGAICLVIVSPLLLGVVLAGSLLGRLLIPDRRNLQLTIVPLLVLLVFLDGAVNREKTGMVMDTVGVAAPAAEVWKYVVAFPRITAEPDYWLNKLGLPSAAETTCEGEFVGAKRECIFSNGLVFKEVVAELEPQRQLTFDVVEQPRDPELLGHVTLHRGQFELQVNADGSTTLIGRSWYTLHVRPLWYFDWWTRDITREVHLRVMNHIKRLAEHRG